MSLDLDQERMRQALSIACSTSWVGPNPRVGCVLVDRFGELLAEGYHAQIGQDHAEVSALKKVKNIKDCYQSTAYVTLEPCSHYGRTPPCALALQKAGISRVVISILDPYQGNSGYGMQWLRNQGIKVDLGLCAAEAKEINIGFFYRHTHARPWIRYKIATSLDGKIALENRKSHWITDPEAIQDAKNWRQRACILLTSASTIRFDNPLFFSNGAKHRAQDCLILNSQLDLLSEISRWKIFTHDLGRRLYLCHSEDLKAPVHLVPNWIRFIPLPHVLFRKKKVLDLSILWKHLAQLEINEIHIEGGQFLATYLLENSWIDEWLIYQAPCLMGANALNCFSEEKSFVEMTELYRFNLYEVEQIKNNIRLRMRAASN